MIWSYERGHKIFYDEDNGIWRYKDTKEVANGKRACKRCGENATKDGYDACKGYIEGKKSVCCGHGVTDSIEM